MAERNVTALDHLLVVLFKPHPELNPAETAKAGRPMYDDQDIVEVRTAGERDVKVFPALEHSHWAVDDMGIHRSFTYAERWSKQYQQYKSHNQQTKSGTPLDHLPFLTPARCAELRALNIYTAEALATVDGQPLKNLGQHGRDLKDRAVEWMEAAKMNTVPAAVLAELEGLRAKNQVLETDIEVLKQGTIIQVPPPAVTTAAGSMFEEMSEGQITEWITSHQDGHAPKGRLNKKTLVQMAEEIAAGRGV